MANIHNKRSFDDDYFQLKICSLTGRTCIRFRPRSPKSSRCQGLIKMIIKLADQIFTNQSAFMSSCCAKIVMLVFVAYFIAYFVYSRIIYQLYAFLNSRATKIMAQDLGFSMTLLELEESRMNLSMCILPLKFGQKPALWQIQAYLQEQMVILTTESIRHNHLSFISIFS